MMKQKAKKYVSLALAFAMSAGLLGSLAGCEKPESGETAANLVSADKAQTFFEGLSVGESSQIPSTERDTETTSDATASPIEASLPESEDTQKTGTAGVSDVIWLTAKPIPLDGVKLFKLEIEGSNGGEMVMDYSGNVLGMYENDIRFEEGFACVKVGDKYGAIDSKGNYVIPLEYENVRHFSEGLCAVEKDKKWGYVNVDGQVVIPPEYDDLEAFSDGLAPVLKGGKWGFIDNKGAIVVPIEYDAIGVFREGLAPVNKDGRWGVIDSNGQVVFTLDDSFYRVDSFYNGFAQVEKIDGERCYINKKGQSFEYDAIGDFYEGLAQVEKDGKIGYISAEGEVVVPLEYDDVDWSGFLEGLCAVKKG